MSKEDKGVPADQKAIVQNAIGSAQIAQEGHEFGKVVDFVEPLINRSVDKAVDYVRTNADPADLGGSELAGGGIGSDCIP